jgi:hypothetical protein
MVWSNPRGLLVVKVPRVGHHDAQRTPEDHLCASEGHHAREFVFVNDGKTRAGNAQEVGV